MDKELTIQQTAELTGLTVHTLRYYERIGLLEPVRRTDNGYRTFSAADLDWIAFLNRLRSTGMPIQAMRRFAELRRMGSATIGRRRELLEAHQDEVRRRIHELERNIASIADKIDHYKELEQDGGIHGDDGAL